VGRPPSPIKNVRRIFTMSPDDALKLAELREVYGLASEAAVIRKLLREAARQIKGPSPSSK
jgi:hypothetical protein